MDGAEPKLQTTDGASVSRPPDRRKRRRWRLLVTLVVLFALLGWFAHFAYLRITRRPTPRPDYWAAQILALDPPPRGAISSEKAAAILSNRPWKTDPAVLAAFPGVVQSGGWFLALGDGWDGSRPDVRAAITMFATAEFKTARDELRHAVETGWRDAPTSLPMPQRDAVSVQYMAWMGWLAAHYRWNFEYLGDLETATEDCCIILCLARQNRRARLPYYRRVDEGRQRVITSAMIRAEQVPGVSIDTSALMRKVDRMLGTMPTLHTIVGKAHALTRVSLETMYVREGGDWLDVCAAAERIAQAGSWWGRGGRRSRLWNLTSPLFHDYATACARADRAMVLLNSADTLIGAEAAKRALAGLGLGPLDGIAVYGFMGEDRFSEIADVLLDEYTTRTELDATLTLFALNEYHCRNDAYPDTLDQLVPEFLPRLPIDYADRQPLRYRRTAEGFLLYSIGQNGVDDGGSCRKPESPWTSGNLDAVFSDRRGDETDK